MEHIFKNLPYEKLVGISTVRIFSWAIVISLLLFFLASLTIIDEAQTKIEKLLKLKNDAENSIQRSHKIIASQEVVGRKLNVVLGELTIKKKQLPRQNAINNIFENVSIIGRQRNVNVTSFSVGGGEVKDFFKKIVLHFKFVGGFWNIMDMFSVLKNMRQIVEISNIIFNVKNKGERTVVISTITATIYIYEDVLPGFE